MATAIATNALVSLAEYKAWAADISGTGQDAVLLDFINSSGEDFIKECGGFVFIKQNFTNEQHQGGVRRIWLNHRPIVSVSSFTDNLGNYVGGQEYFIQKEQGYLEYDGAAFPSSRGFWSITYRAGKWDALANVTGEVKVATYLNVRHMQRSKLPNVTNVARSGRGGSRSRTVALSVERSGLPSEVRSKLRDYLTPWV